MVKEVYRGWLFRGKSKCTDPVIAAWMYCADIVIHSQLRGPPFTPTFLHLLPTGWEMWSSNLLSDGSEVELYNGSVATVFLSLLTRSLRKKKGKNLLLQYFVYMKLKSMFTSSCTVQDVVTFQVSLCCQLFCLESLSLIGIFSAWVQYQ